MPLRKTAIKCMGRFGSNLGVRGRLLWGTGVCVPLRDSSMSKVPPLVSNDPNHPFTRFCAALNRLPVAHRDEFLQRCAAVPEGPERDEWLLRNTSLLNDYLDGCLEWDVRDLDEP